MGKRKDCFTYFTGRQYEGFQIVSGMRLSAASEDGEVVSDYLRTGDIPDLPEFDNPLNPEGNLTLSLFLASNGLEDIPDDTVMH